MRVNVVRNAWKVVRPDSLLAGRTFYDSSLWERRQIEDPETVKRVIREGVGYTSAVCVLVGTETATRRWVRYEIARAVIDKRGLLAVHLNGIRHHQFLVQHVRGSNALAQMAVGKIQPYNALLPPVYYLFEYTPQGWVRYQDYTNPVSLPAYLPDPRPGYVMPLAAGTAGMGLRRERRLKEYRSLDRSRCTGCRAVIGISRPPSTASCGRPTTNPNLSLNR